MAWARVHIGQITDLEILWLFLFILIQFNCCQSILALRGFMNSVNTRNTASLLPSKARNKVFQCPLRDMYCIDFMLRVCVQFINS